MGSNKRLKMGNVTFTVFFMLLSGIICLNISVRAKRAKRIADFRLPIDSLDKEEAFETPKFAINQKVGVYRIEISASPTITPAHKNFIYVFAELYNKKGERVNEFETEFWWETGRDSDGTWTEKDKDEDWLFKNRKQNDSLYLEIVGEKRLLRQAYYRERSQNRSYRYKRYTESIRIQVWEDPQGAVRRYFLVFGIIFMVLFIFSLFGYGKK